MSVTREAIEIYLDAKAKVENLNKEDGIKCQVGIHGDLKFRGSVCGNFYSFCHQEDGGFGELEFVNAYLFRKITPRDSHILLRYLLQENVWDKEELRKVQLTILKPIKNLDTTNTKVYGLRSKDSDLLRIRGKEGPLEDSVYLFAVPAKSIDALDTVLYLLTGKEPTLTNFRPKTLFEGKEAKADIRQIPELPRLPKPEINAEKMVKIPVETIVQNITTHRKEVKKKYEDVMAKARAIAGNAVTKISCNREDRIFWQEDGMKFGGRAGFNKPFLEYGQFAIERSIDTLTVDRFLRQNNFKRIEYPTYHDSCEIKVPQYLAAESLIDLLGDGTLSVVCVSPDGKMTYTLKGVDYTEKGSEEEKRRTSINCNRRIMPGLNTKKLREEDIAPFAAFAEKISSVV